MRAYYDVELAERETRPLPAERRTRLSAFVDLCRGRGAASVLEVGCGAGRDGVVISRAGLAYTGVDLSVTGAQICRRLGLRAAQASAVGLPFRDASFDAAWCMSTLMHLPGDDIVQALFELRRVIRPGGFVEVGVWGADTSRAVVDARGRLFRHRTDQELAELLSAVGSVEAFETWDRRADTGHYQWARVAPV